VLVLPFFLLLYADFAVCVGHIFPNNDYEINLFSLFNTLGINFCLFMAFWAHYTCMTSDPGAVPLPTPDQEIRDVQSLEPFEKFGEMVTICRKCNFYKPLVAHHCSTCKRCIRKLDHHCPWVNNCVGEYNQRHFLLFLLYILLSCLYTGVYIGSRMFTCLTVSPEACRMKNPTFETIVGIFALFEAMLFGLFVTIMAAEQLNGIRRNASKIDRLKGMASGGGMNTEKSTFFQRLAEVFGGGDFSWRWFLPLSYPLKNSSWYP
jgi:ribosomal protein L40E